MAIKNNLTFYNNKIIIKLRTCILHSQTRILQLAVPSSDYGDLLLLATLESKMHLAQYDFVHNYIDHFQYVVVLYHL